MASSQTPDPPIATEMVEGAITFTDTTNDRLTLAENTRGEMTLLFSKEEPSTVQDAAGKDIDFDELKVGDQIKAEVRSAMTMSSPPQTVAVRITITGKNLPVANPPFKTMNITGQISRVDVQNSRILIDQEGAGNETGMVEVLVDPEVPTIIIGTDGNELDIASLQPGTNVTAAVRMAFTKSVPPQTTAATIQVENLTGGTVNDATTGESSAIIDPNMPASINLTGEIKSVDAPRNRFDLDQKTGNPTSDIVTILINPEMATSIIDRDGNTIDLTSLRAGDKVTTEVRSAFTRSLPPQTVAFKIQVVEQGLSSEVTDSVASSSETTSDAPGSPAPAGGVTTPKPQSVVYQGSVTEINASNNMVTIDPDGSGNPVTMLVLNVNPLLPTTITGADGNALKLGDLKVGDKVKAEVSPAMSRSLPPQTSAFNITVLGE